MTIRSQRGWILLGCLGVVAGAICAAAPRARAGEKEHLPITIDLVQRVATGQMADARRSADDQSAIEIAISAGAKGSTAQVTFTDAKGNVAMCQTSAEPMVRTLQTVPSDGALRVRWDDDDGCVSVEVWNASYNRPKIP
jgi:hypothetical protein